MVAFVSDQDIARVLDIGSVKFIRDSIDRAFAALARGDAAIKPRQRIDCGTTKLSSMGAIWGGDVALALEKSYTTKGGQFAFVITLFDTTSNRLLAVMEGQELTRLRTAALTALAIQKGAQRTRKLALFGAGLQGRTHFLALTELFPFEQVNVVDVADVSEWCAEMAVARGLDVRQCDAAGAIANADVVVTTTRSKMPLFDGERLARGAFIAAVGTSLPGGTELDVATLRRAARVVVEWKPQSLAEAGEIDFGRREGVLSDDRINDLLDMYAGRSTWRNDDNEVLVFKSVGVGLSDLAAAAVAWQRLAGALG